MPSTRDRNSTRSEASTDDLLVRGALSLGLCLTVESVAAFRLYQEELLRWSGRMNLTAFAHPAQIVREGFLDSLSCALLLPEGARKILDIGTGPGFPAIPLALAKPHLEFTLVEVSRKKLTFLRHVVRQLQLPKVRIVAGRIETLLKEGSMLGVFDAAVARAVAPLFEVGLLVFPFLRQGGVFLAQVGPGEGTREAVMGLVRSGFEEAGEAAVPVAFGKPGRRIVALRKSAV